MSVILSSVKNPSKKASLKKAMLKVYKTIATVYAGDPDFQAVSATTSGATGD